MVITAKLVNELRERTGVGMMDCKGALTESNGDIDKAIEILRKKGIAKASGKALRIAVEGLVGIHLEKGAAVVAEVNCETDFVAKGDKFKNLSAKLMELIAKTNPKDVESFYAQKYDNSLTVDAAIKTAIAETGENIKVRRFDTYITKNYIASYIHMGGKIGVLAEFEVDSSVWENSDFVEMTKDITMHIAAMNPPFLNADSIPASVIEKEKEIYREQIKAQKKPENMIEKIAEGMLGKFKAESCLVEQVFVKDNTKKVKDVIAEVAKKCGKPITMKRFSRLALGEGIEKKKEDFAAEVSKMVGA